MKHYICWCHRPTHIAFGCSFKDGTLMFDVEEEDGSVANVKEVEKGPANNVYYYINHTLFDPLEKMFEELVLKFYSTTF